MGSDRPVIAITAGEPAGIGPDLCALIAREDFDAHLVFIADPGLLRQRAALRGITLALPEYAPTRHSTGCSVYPVALASAVAPGHLDLRNAPYVLRTLDAAIDGCLQQRFAAMVTAPVQKSVINDAGIAFTGHTEYLAQKSGCERVVMMLAGGDLRVALATTHLPLAAVPQAITRESLHQTLRILHADLVRRFGLTAPRILVTGLNPHAGESGHLGREEIEVITPVVQALRAEGMRLQGPLPADTLFTAHHLREADCVLAMYHDQGLPVLKYASFGQAVNITLGLPFIRTSVDHGTALDKAGQGEIDTGSLRAAIDLAIRMAKSSQPPSR